MSQYFDQREREQLAAQRKLEAEAREREEKEKAKLLKKAEKEDAKGNEEAANSLRMEAETVQVIAPVVAPFNLVSLSMSTAICKSCFLSKTIGLEPGRTMQNFFWSLSIAKAYLPFCKNTLSEAEKFDSPSSRFCFVFSLLFTSLP